MTDCPGMALDEDAPDPVCLACGYPVCGSCTTTHALAGTHLCRPCAEGYGGEELAETLESSAAYLAALANLCEDPALAGSAPGDDRPPAPEECRENERAMVNGLDDQARCEECGSPACTHCEAHLTDGHARCDDCGRQLMHALPASGGPPDN
ncbi:hypothetical protein [Streptomyces sp. NPDC048269]|uniref:hypothetical protein n=1 Tax=Streptomyces sp. NPDC048269 TaxID=3155753 RepID=UPI003422C006